MFGCYAETDKLLDQRAIRRSQVIQWGTSQQCICWSHPVGDLPTVYLLKSQTMGLWKLLLSLIVIIADHLKEQLLGSCPLRHLKLHYNAIHHKSNSWAAVLQGISSWTTMQSTTRVTLGQLSSKASQAALQCNPPQEQLLGSCPPRHLKLHYNAIHHKSNSWAAVLQGISSWTTMQSTTRATLGQLSSKASQAALPCNPPQEQLLGSCPPRHLKLHYNAIHHKSNPWAGVLQGISSWTTMQSTTRATLGQLSSKASQAGLQCNPPQEQPLGSCPPRHLKLNYNAIRHKSNPWTAVLQGISSCTTMQSTTRATLGQLSSKASQAAVQCNPPQ